MAQGANLSDFFTALQATPRAKSDIHRLGGRLRVKHVTVTVAAGDANGDIHGLCRFGAKDRIWAIYGASGGITTSSANIGLYPASTWTGDGAEPTPKDADILVDGWDPSGVVQPTQILGVGAASVDEEDYGDPLWSLAGDSEGDVDFYDVAIEHETGDPSAGDLNFAFLYTAGD